MKSARWVLLLPGIWLSACESVTPAPIEIRDHEPMTEPVEVSRTWTRPGFVIEGEDFRTLMAFEDRQDEPQVYARHELEGADPVEAWLEFASPWMADAHQRFQGETDQGADVQVRLEAGPCQTVSGQFTYFAEVTIGALLYSGCARETGPVTRWIHDFDEALADIAFCEAHLGELRETVASDIGSRRVTYWTDADGQGSVIYQMQSVGRVECLVFSRRPEWTVLPDGDPAYPGEGDPVFVPGRLPEQGEGCYLYERVRDRDGELIGALGHDACGV